MTDIEKMLSDMGQNEGRKKVIDCVNRLLDELEAKARENDETAELDIKLGYFCLMAESGDVLTLKSATVGYKESSPKQDLMLASLLTGFVRDITEHTGKMAPNEV